MRYSSEDLKPLKDLFVEDKDAREDIDTGGDEEDGDPETGDPCGRCISGMDW